jgi:predicted phosphoribosyltransferase
MFTDRRDAGRKLASTLVQHPAVLADPKKIVIVSLLRGGIVVGAEIAHALKSPHLPLAVAKIGAPGHEELAVGAVCFNFTYTDPAIVHSLGLDRHTLKTQIQKAHQKFESYAKRFNLREEAFNAIKNKTVIVTDDGLATGATVRAAYLFLKSKRPKKLILAIPVGPTDFEAPPFDEVMMLQTDPAFAAVSQYYEDFHEVSDEEVKRFLG